MRRHRNPSVHHNHFLHQIQRVEFAAQSEKRLLAGREIVRAICSWFSVRSELGQHRISRDIFKVVIDPNRPDADLYHFYNDWTDVHQQLYGVRPPSDEMRASIHPLFLEQCRKPTKLSMICQFFDLSSDKPGTGMRTYEWLIAQIEMMMLREKEQ
eukprot:532580-Pyramimonas_sp.AAC.1